MMKRFVGFVCGLLLGYIICLIVSMIFFGVTMDGIFSFQLVLFSLPIAIFGYLYPDKIISALQGIFPF